MSNGPNVGYATLQIIPSMRGIAAKLSSELEGPARKAGDDAGRKSGDGFLDGMGGKLKAGMVLVGVAAAAALTKGFFDAMGAEDVQARLMGQLGVDEATAATLGQAASNVYRDAWGDSLAQVGDAVAAVQGSLSDVGAADLESATAKALAFAKTFDTDVASAVGSVSTLIGSGLVDDSTQAFDLITAALQKVPMSLRGEIMDASNEYSQFFNALGLNGQEAFGLLVDASSDGQYGIDKMGDALKELTIRSTDMSKTSVEAYKLAGLSAEDMSARFVAGGDTARGALSDLVTGLQGIEDPTARANAAIALFGTPLEDLGVTEIPAFLDSLANMGGALGDTEGAADRMVDALGGTNSSKMEAFRRKAFGKLSDFVAKVVIPAFERFAGWWQKHWPEISATAAAVFSAIAAGWTQYVAPVLATVASAFQSAFGWLMDNQEFLVGIAAGLTTVLAVMFATWAAGAIAAGAATLLAAAPFIALGVAVAGLVAGVIWAYENVNWFRDSVDAVARFLTGTLWPAMQSVFGWLADNVPPILATVWGWFKQLWDGSESLRQLWVAGLMFAVSTVTTVFGAVRAIVERVWVWMQYLWDRTEGLRGFLGGVFTAGLDAVIVVFGLVRDAVGWVITKVDTLIKRLKDVIEWATAAIDKAKGLFTPDLTGKVGFPGVGANAAGTSNWRGGLTWINERGPELVNLPRGTEIFSHQKSMRMLNEAGSSTGPAFPDHLTLMIEGRPFTAMIAEHDRELLAGLAAGVS